MMTLLRQSGVTLLSIRIHDVKLLGGYAVRHSFEYFRKVCSKRCSKASLQLLIAAAEVELLLPNRSWFIFQLVSWSVLYIRLPSSEKVAGCCVACLDQVLSSAHQKSGSALSKAGDVNIWSMVQYYRKVL